MISVVEHISVVITPVWCRQFSPLP